MKQTICARECAPTLQNFFGGKMDVLAPLNTLYDISRPLTKKWARKCKKIHKKTHFFAIFWNLFAGKQTKCARRSAHDRKKILVAVWMYLPRFWSIECSHTSYIKNGQQNKKKVAKNGNFSVFVVYRQNWAKTAFLVFDFWPIIALWLM